MHARGCAGEGWLGAQQPCAGVNSEGMDADADETLEPVRENGGDSTGGGGGGSGGGPGGREQRLSRRPDHRGRGEKLRVRRLQSVVALSDGAHLARHAGTLPGRQLVPHQDPHRGGTGYLRQAQRRVRGAPRALFRRDRLCVCQPAHGAAGRFRAGVLPRAVGEHGGVAGCQAQRRRRGIEQFLAPSAVQMDAQHALQRLPGGSRLHHAAAGGVLLLQSGAAVHRRRRLRSHRCRAHQHHYHRAPVAGSGFRTAKPEERHRVHLTDVRRLPGHQLRHALPAGERH
eukprot:ctg_466.g240